MNGKLAKANFAASAGFFLIALGLVLLGNASDFRIACFYMGMLCIGAGFFFRA